MKLKVTAAHPSGDYLRIVFEARWMLFFSKEHAAFAKFGEKRCFCRTYPLTPDDEQHLIDGANALIYWANWQAGSKEQSDD